MGESGETAEEDRNSGRKGKIEFLYFWFYRF